MKLDFTVYTDTGHADSLTSAVKVAFTLTPWAVGSATRCPTSVVCKTMTFGAQGRRPSRAPKPNAGDTAISSLGVAEEVLWELETMFAFSKYEPISNKQRRVIGKLWPTAPGQSRTIGNQTARERSSAESPFESIVFSNTIMSTTFEEEESFALGSSTLGSSPLGSSTLGSSTSGSSTSRFSTSELSVLGSSHLDGLTERARAEDTQSDEEWSHPHSYYDMNELEHASVVAINESGTSQNLALYIRNPTDSLYDTIAVYDSVQDKQRVIASSFLRLQAYVVSDTVCDYDILSGSDLDTPIFELPLACDSIPPSSKWRLCMGEHQKIRLVMDDLNLWCMKKRLDAVIATVERMETSDVLTIIERLTTSETNLSSLDQKFTTAVETNSQELCDHISTTSDRFDRLEGTVSKHDVTLGHLETQVGDIQGELTRTREEVQTVEIKWSLKGAQEKVVAIEDSLKDTQDGLPHFIEKTFQESETIRSTMEKRVERQCTTIVDSALSNELSSLGARVEKTEKNLFLIEESVNVVDVKVAKIDTSLSELRHETEQSLSLVGRSVENVNRRVDEVETSLSELRQAVPEIFKETVLHSQELREKTETTVRESEVIREAINNMVVASDVGSRLVVVENKTLDVEKTVKDAIREVLVSVVEPQISDIKIESEETNSRLAEVEGTVTNNFTQLSSKLETHVQDTERTLSWVQESVTKVDTKIETVESSLLELRGETERSLSQVGESVKKVDARVNQVEKSLSELRREVPKIFKETIHTSVELQEKMETVVRDNVVIRETINNMVVASDVGSRLSVVEADIDGITKTLESDVEPRLSDLEGKEIPQLKLLIESINTHVTKLDHTTTTEITALDDARQRMLQSVTEVRTSVSELSTNLNDQIEDVRTHTERRLELVEGSVRRIDGTLSSQDEKVTIMKEELRNDIGEIAQLTANVQSELNSFIVNCSKEHDTLKSDIDRVEREAQQTLARHQTSIDALGGQINTLDGQINTLDGRVTVVEKSAFAGVSDLSEEMQRRLEDAARELAEVDKRTNERVDRVDERVTGVDGRVTEVNGQVNKRTTRLAEQLQTNVTNTSHIHKFVLKTRQDLDSVQKIAVGGFRNASRVYKLAEETSVRQTTDGGPYFACSVHGTHVEGEVGLCRAVHQFGSGTTEGMTSAHQTTGIAFQHASNASTFIGSNTGESHMATGGSHSSSRTAIVTGVEMSGRPMTTRGSLSSSRTTTTAGASMSGSQMANGGSHSSSRMTVVSEGRTGVHQTGTIHQARSVV